VPYKFFLNDDDDDDDDDSCYKTRSRLTMTNYKAKHTDSSNVHLDLQSAIAWNHRQH